MALAIFSREFNWSRPKSRFSFNAKASIEPKSFPHDFVDAAVAAGAAVRVRGKRHKETVETADQSAT